MLSYEQQLPVAIIWREGVAYHDPAVRAEISSIQAAAVEEPSVRDDYTRSWLDDWEGWAAEVGAAPGTPSEFAASARLFLSDARYAHHSGDVVFGGEENGEAAAAAVVETSRTWVVMSELSSTEEQVDAMLGFYAAVERGGRVDPAPLPASFAFVLFTQFAIIEDELVANLLMCLVAVAALAAVALRHWLLSVLVVVLLVAIDVDLVGGIKAWGLELNSISLIPLVMAVGLCVDYLAHIAHYYVHVDAPSTVGRDARAHRLGLALNDVGPSVCNGIATTILGITPLAFAGSAVFRVFYRMFLNIILYAAVHGMFVLPVALILFPVFDVPGPDGGKGRAQAKQLRVVTKSPVAAAVVAVPHRHHHHAVDLISPPTANTANHLAAEAVTSSGFKPLPAAAWVRRGSAAAAAGAAPGSRRGSFRGVDVVDRSGAGVGGAGVVGW